MIALAGFVLLATLNLSNGFYLPGLASVTYCTEAKENDNCQVSDATK